MGIVRTQITLRNAGDVSYARRGDIQEKDVRQVTLNAMVDTGAGTLVINEEVCAQLGLEIQGLRRATFGNAAREICKVTEPVEITWEKRFCNCSALVVKDANEVLLGAIPLEDMDLIVNPAEQKLVGAHGDEVVCLVM